LNNIKGDQRPDGGWEEWGKFRSFVGHFNDFGLYTYGELLVGLRKEMTSIRPESRDRGKQGYKQKNQLWLMYFIFAKDNSSLDKHDSKKLGMDKNT
jgi:hypothetical protein